MSIIVKKSNANNVAKKTQFLYAANVYREVQGLYREIGVQEFLTKFFGKILSIYFLTFFYKITKMKIKSFEFPQVYKKYKKNNTWKIRLLVDDSFVPSSKQPSLIYCRLTEFNFIISLSTTGSVR